MKIVTEFVYPPIPIRRFDWSAHYDGREEGPTGHGSTEAEAVTDLKENYDMATDFAWVIENGSGSDLRYYAPTEPGEWSKDHLKACRFARKEDAEAIQFRHVTHGPLPVDGTRVCEHGWG